MHCTMSARYAAVCNPAAGTAAAAQLLTTDSMTLSPAKMLSAFMKDVAALHGKAQRHLLAAHQLLLLCHK
jgi:hypothetical protein